jgi:hypothetical protein
VGAGVLEEMVAAAWPPSRISSFAASFLARRMSTASTWQQMIGLKAQAADVERA